MWSQFGLSWAEAVGAVVTTVVMYAAVLIVLRLIGPRLVNGFSAVDAAATLAVGAIVGRTALGDRVTLSDGVVALVTLTVVHVVLRRIVGHRTLVRGGPPLVVMRDGAVRGDALRSIGIGEHELAARLRRTGVSSYEQVVCAVWEPTGELSVFTDRDIDPRLLSGVSDGPGTP